MATFYVDATNGSDTTGTGTEGNPVASMKVGFRIASGGDTVYVKNGSYGLGTNGSRFVGTLGRTPFNDPQFKKQGYVNFVPFPGHEPIVSEMFMSSIWGMRFINFHVECVTTNGALPNSGDRFLYNDCRHIQFVNCDFPGGAPTVQSAVDIRHYSCDFHDGKRTTATCPADAQDGCGQVVAGSTFAGINPCNQGVMWKKCTFHDIPMDGLQLNGPSYGLLIDSCDFDTVFADPNADPSSSNYNPCGDHADGIQLIGVHHVTIKNNTFKNTFFPIQQGAQGQNTNVKIYNNVFVGRRDTAYGISLHSVQGLWIVNNTFYGHSNTYGGISCDQDGVRPFTHVFIVNNVFETAALDLPAGELKTRTNNVVGQETLASGDIAGMHHKRPSMTVQGTSGSTAYFYALVAKDASGNRSSAQTDIIGTGNATLDATNKIRLSWSPVNAADGGYDVLKQVGGGEWRLLGTVAQGGSIRELFDTGQSTSNYTLPIRHEYMKWNDDQNSDFRLLTGSPLIGAGSTTDLAGFKIPTTDIRGEARSGGNDVGAYQRVAGDP